MVIESFNTRGWWLEGYDEQRFAIGIGNSDASVLRRTISIDRVSHTRNRIGPIFYNPQAMTSSHWIAIMKGQFRRCAEYNSIEW